MADGTDILDAVLDEITTVSKKEQKRKPTNGRRSTVAPEADIRIWYQRVMATFKNLAAEEVATLGQCIRENGDIEARNKLVQHHLLFAYKIASRYMERASIDRMDYAQAANIGLLIAASKFDERIGVVFATYASAWVRQSIRQTIHDCGSTIRVPSNVIQAYYKVSRCERLLRRELGREPTNEEIAQKAEFDTRLVERAQKYALLRIVSTDEAADADSQERKGFFARELLISEQLSPEDMTIAREQLVEYCNDIRTLLWTFTLLKGMKDRNIDIFKKRYGLYDNTFEGWTLEEISREHNLTRERVRQIVEKMWIRVAKHIPGASDAWLQTRIESIYSLETVTGTFAKI